MRLRFSHNFIQALALFSLLFCACSLPKKNRVQEKPRELDIPLRRHMDQPIHYLDNNLPFQPIRIWRLWVSWDEDPEDQSKARLTKEWQLVVHNLEERQKLEAEIASRGGDEAYLRWFESEMFPQGSFEVRDQARIARFSDTIVVVLVTRALRGVPREGNQIRVAPIRFPEPLMRKAFENCGPHNWDEFHEGQSFGMEVVLESHKTNAEALKWKPREVKVPHLQWLTWSVGQGRRVAYRRALFIKTSFARCPPPPKLYNVVQELRRWKPMAIEW